MGLPGAVVEGKGGGTWRDFRIGYGVVVNNASDLKEVPQSLRLTIGLTQFVPGPHRRRLDPATQRRRDRRHPPHHPAAASLAEPALSRARRDTRCTSRCSDAHRHRVGHQAERILRGRLLQLQRTIDADRLHRDLAPRRGGAVRRARRRRGASEPTTSDSASLSCPAYSSGEAVASRSARLRSSWAVRRACSGCARQAQERVAHRRDRLRAGAPRIVRLLDGEARHQLRQLAAGRRALAAAGDHDHRARDLAVGGVDGGALGRVDLLDGPARHLDRLILLAPAARSAWRAAPPRAPCSGSYGPARPLRPARAAASLRPARGPPTPTGHRPPRPASASMATLMERVTSGRLGCARRACERLRLRREPLHGVRRLRLLAMVVHERNHAAGEQSGRSRQRPSHAPARHSHRKTFECSARAGLRGTLALDGAVPIDGREATCRRAHERATLDTLRSRAERPHG